jgi:hypothetical protein
MLSFVSSITIAAISAIIVAIIITNFYLFFSTPSSSAAPSSMSLSAKSVGGSFVSPSVVYQLVDLVMK